jgi:hypothetical protein
MTRSEFMQKVGAQMTNPQWSWVGINHSNKQVFFSTWEHFNQKEPEKPKDEYLIFAEFWGNAGRSPGHSDAKIALHLVSKEQYTPCLLFLEATEKFSFPDAKPEEEVSIKNVRGSFYFTAEISEISGKNTPNEMVFARRIERINIS